MVENTVDNRYVVLHNLKLGEFTNNIGQRKTAEVKLGDIIKGKVISKREFNPVIPNPDEKGLIYLISNPIENNPTNLQKFFVPISEVRLLEGAVPAVAKTSPSSPEIHNIDEKTEEVPTSTEKLYFGMKKKTAILVGLGFIAVIGYVTYRRMKNKVVNQ